MADRPSTRRPGEPRPIDVFYVALATQADGSEAIVGTSTERIVGTGTERHTSPLICPGRSGLEVMEQLAREASKATGDVIRIVRFERGRIVREFTPP